MRKISLWGKEHKWAARLIITVSSLLIFLIAFNLGYKLNQAGSILPFSVFTGISAIYLIMILVYPYSFEKRSQRESMVFYRRRKLSDLILAFCSFGMFLFIGNQPGQLINLSSGVHAAVPLTVSNPTDVKPYKSLSSFNKSMKDENGKLLKWKERKKLLKEQVKGIKTAKDLSKGAKTLLSILSVLVALGLIMLVAALACDLSCNGSGAAAVLVGVGGTALIIFLLVITLRGINGKGKKTKKPVPDSTGS